VDAEGHFLHDFSYAGYHHGEAEPAAPAAAQLFDVVSRGADPTGVQDSTAAAQSAIDEAVAAGGGVVFFPAGLYRMDGVLGVTSSSIVLRGEGPTTSRLSFTRSVKMSFASHITFSGDGASDLEIHLEKDGAARARFVEVADAADLSAGDDIEIGWFISPEFIAEHGMTGTWTAFNDTWQVFFRRTIVSVDKTASPPRVELDVPLRYAAKTRDKPSLKRVRTFLREVGVESLGIANAVAWDDAWTMNQTHAIGFERVLDGWLRDVASFPSPMAPSVGPGSGAHLASSGIIVSESARFTVDHVELGPAENRGGGGNGYLFEIRQSNEVLVKDSKGDAGRHNFIQNWGFGTTGCVFLRVSSQNGETFVDKADTLGFTGFSEFHHSLATANLIDQSAFDDGFSIVNRQGESTGAGHTGTQNVLWNLSGKGTLRSLQFGFGYVIGTKNLFVVTESPLPMAEGTAPVDWIEGQDEGDKLEPASLYEDQRARRLGAK